MTGTLVPDGTAADTDCLNTKTFYSGDSWIQKTGSITTQTLSAANDTVTAGYYAATTLSTVDSDLATANIKNGATIFGVNGSTKVLDTSTGTAANSDLASGKTCFSNGSTITGGMTTGDNVTVTSNTPASIPTGYYSGKTCSAALTGGTGTLAAEGQILSTYHAYNNTGAVLQGSITSGSNVPGANAALSFSIPTGYYSGNSCIASDTNLAEGNIKKGTAIFGTTGTMYPGSLLATGQKVCYDASGAVIDCTGTGQDGELKKGLALTPPYTDNNTTPGTITDNATGLVWQKCSAGLSDANCATGSAATYTWANALTYCNANTAGLPGTGWRLPNRRELLSIVDYSTSAPAINSTYFPATPGIPSASTFWSATTHQTPADQGSAFPVTFWDGSSRIAGVGAKTFVYYVRCVRGG